MIRLLDGTNILISQDTSHYIAYKTEMDKLEFILFMENDEDIWSLQYFICRFPLIESVLVEYFTLFWMNNFYY